MRANSREVMHIDHIGWDAAHSVVEEMSQYGVWERQLRLASIPNEIESRCRCKGWGRAQGEASRGPNPPSPTCEIDERYFVGSKRTM